MIDVLGWYEIWYSIGLNIGPGLPALFSQIDFYIGQWKIDGYNIINILLVLITTIVLILSWFHISDLSKSLDRIKLKFNVLSKQQGEEDKEEKKNGGEEKFDEKTETGLIKWRQLLQIDIISLCLEYGIMRYVVNTCVTMVTFYAFSIFKWGSSSLGWLNLVIGSLSYVIIALLLKLHIFNKSLRRVYTFYLIASIFCVMVLLGLLIPSYVVIEYGALQVVVVAIPLTMKCYIWFHAQSSGKVLLFHTVTHQNSSFIDGLRSTFGAIARMFAVSTSFLFYMHPTAFAIPFSILQTFLIILLLVRRDQHTTKSKD